MNSSITVPGFNTSVAAAVPVASGSGSPPQQPHIPSSTYSQAELLQVIHDSYIGGMIQDIAGYKESHIHDDPDVSQYAIHYIM